MTHVETGPGLIQPYRITTEFASAGLYNFDIDWAELKTEHRNWLKANVFEMLEAGGSITLKGQTSRSALEAHNLALSRRRLISVVMFLRQRVGYTFNFRSVDAVGESAAAAAGQVDDDLPRRRAREDPWWRSVVLSAWRRPEPPPPPTIQPPPWYRPCDEVRFYIKYNTALLRAWGATNAGTGPIFRDTGGEQSRCLPDYHAFMGAMGMAFPGQAQLLWNNYDGVVGHTFGEERMQALRDVIRQDTLEEDLDLCSDEVYPPAGRPIHELRPGRPLRGPSGDNGT